MQQKKFKRVKNKHKGALVYQSDTKAHIVHMITDIIHPFTTIEVSQIKDCGRQTLKSLVIVRRFIVTLKSGFIVKWLKGKGPCFGN